MCEYRIMKPIKIVFEKRTRTGGSPVISATQKEEMRRIVV
jgi:hypothetical protein